MSPIYKNINNYTKYGTVPTIEKGNNSQIPQNTFYKSVHYIDSVIGPIKDAVFGVGGSKRKNTIGNRQEFCVGTTIRVITLPITTVLSILYLTFAYLSYWPLKGLAKITDNSYLKKNTESLVNYANVLLKNASSLGCTITSFVNIILSYVCTGVIWAAALVITPLVWTVEKVGNKLNEVFCSQPLDKIINNI
ncbi:hypothetical protein [Wolbachia endosymbiont of Chironomus riparius]|uniref:hypothetical protein n=1 Tax=Wolbachia endosymbiont of Chironomus riparius TaxID=2883238 RepID=UPI0020A12F54|nr:hypothetical protein [Wolbachia endosymbiont of Chironomus riparius]